MNAVEIEEAVSNLASEPFDASAFPYVFLEAFGNKAATIAKLKNGTSNASDVPNGVLQRTNIHIATCAAGEVNRTLGLLRASPKTATAKAKFVLATDGEMIEAEDLTSDAPPLVCTYEDLPNNFGYFLPLAGITTVKQIRENAFDIRATGRLNKLYMTLRQDNPDWDKPERRHDMNHFMARLIFCFFAESTDIFNGEGLFTQTIDQMSARDASNTHEVVSTLFRAMNIRMEHRAAANMPRWSDVFPYVNGELFSGSTDVPRFTRTTRSYLMHIGNLDWRRINPDIFGSMIQAVADDEERNSLGMHYTNESNILRVLNPLFLDSLHKQLEQAGTNGRKLLNLRSRMARMRIFDPACGSGNFLVIAYKQMRAIEAEINKRRGEPDRRTDIPLTNFRGIEIKDFPAEIARLALIIAEYQCDVIYRGQQEALAEFLPLDAQNWITRGNALRLDWLSICPPTGTGVKLQGDDLFSTPLNQAQIDFENIGGETYICGNPPYKGGTEQDAFQKSDMHDLFDISFETWKSLDYVLGFFYKARQYISHTDASVAFVTTNSVCQGEQVFRFWPTVITDGCRIHFAVTSFKWSNLASYKAGVTVCIVGLSRQTDLPRLYNGEYGQIREVENINAYLVPYRDVYVKNATKPLQGLSPVVNGSKPADGGGLVFDADIAQLLRGQAPSMRNVIRPFFGAHDAMQGVGRYCIWASSAEYEYLKDLSVFAERFQIVTDMRNKSEKALTKDGASAPYAFQQVRQSGDEIVFQIPRHSSEERDYYPIGPLPTGSIVGDGGFAFFDPPLWNVAVLVSRLALCWIGAVCGKIKTDYRFSNTLGWNTLPFPTLTDNNRADLADCAEDILLAREAHFPATIADLYEVKDGVSLMPDDLKRAHDRNDEVLERIYIGRRFKNDTERLEKLFDMYAKMTAAKGAGDGKAKKAKKGGMQ